MRDRNVNWFQAKMPRQRPRKNLYSRFDFESDGNATRNRESGAGSKFEISPHDSVEEFEVNSSGSEKGKRSNDPTSRRGMFLVAILATTATSNFNFMVFGFPLCSGRTL